MKINIYVLTISVNPKFVFLERLSDIVNLHGKIN